MSEKEKKTIDASIELFDYLELTTRELYQKIKTYLRDHYNISQVAFLNMSEEKISNDEKLNLQNIEEELRNLSYEVGELKELPSGKGLVLPIYLSQESSQFFYMVSEDKEIQLHRIFLSFLKSCYKLRLEKDKVKTWEVLASTDEVTGLFNQRKLTEDLETAVMDHQKHHETFSIMFIDVDHFKNVNDNYGHIVGSQLLKDMGVFLKKILRQTDHIYRYGGDEFVIIMPNVKIEVVHKVAARVLKQLKSYDFKIDNGDIYKMSISIGIAEYPTDAKSAVDIIRFADEMMYKSKKSGRGRVFHVNEVTNADADSQ